MGLFGISSKRAQPPGPRVSGKYCSRAFNGKYPHVGLYDCAAGEVWVCKPLNGQAIRTSHARLITGCANATGTVWKDRFLCYWFYTPNTGEGYVMGYPIDWQEAHLLVRIDPHWDYDNQALLPLEQEEQINDNLSRQFAHGEKIFDFFKSCRLHYPVSLHFVGQRATDSLFYVKRIESQR